MSVVEFARHGRREDLVEYIAFVLFGGGMLLGLALIAYEDRFLNSPSWAFTFGLGRPTTWGIGFLILGTIFFVSVWRRMGLAWPSFLGALYATAVTVTVAQTVSPASTGLPSLFIFALIVTAIWTGVAYVYSRESRR